MFKKIYIEITNICNLKCKFCPDTSRVKAYMTTEKFEKIMADHIERFAKDFSDKVGGFFDKNGMTGEKERIYQ